MVKKNEGLPQAQQKKPCKNRERQTSLNSLRDKKAYLKLYLPKKQILFLQRISNGNISKKVSDILEAYYQEEAHFCIDCRFNTVEKGEVICIKHNRIVEFHNTCQEFKEYQIAGEER